MSISPLNYNNNLGFGFNYGQNQGYFNSSLNAGLSGYGQGGFNGLNLSQNINFQPMSNGFNLSQNIGFNPVQSYQQPSFGSGFGYGMGGIGGGLNNYGTFNNYGNFNINNWFGGFQQQQQAPQYIPYAMPQPIYIPVPFPVQVQQPIYIPGYPPQMPDVQPPPPPPPDNWSGATGGTWGDPHFKSLNNKSANQLETDFDVTGEAGKIYNVLSDKNVQFNSRFVVGDPSQGTIMGQMGIKLKDDSGKENQIEFDAITGKAKFNGKEVKDGEKLTLKMNGEDATVEYKQGPVWGGTGKNLNIHTKEYDINLQQSIDGNHGVQSVKVNKDGVMQDWVNPNGILGQTADGSDLVRKGKVGRGAQGEGAIDYDYKKYEVNDLFGNGDKDINRYGIDVGFIMKDGKVSKTYNKATGQLLTTLDTNGKLVSIRHIEQPDGSIKLFLPDGKTELDKQGNIIK